MDNEQSRATIPNRRKASKGITTINECFMSGSYFQIVGQEKSMQKEFSSFAKLKRQGPVLRSPRWLKPMGSITRKGKKKRRKQRRRAPVFLCECLLKSLVEYQNTNLYWHRMKLWSLKRNSSRRKYNFQEVKIEPLQKLTEGWESFFFFFFFLIYWARHTLMNTMRSKWRWKRHHI